ncbi:MAG: formyltetrahydrofolate deformylase [uncultured archaeon A07HB70]|nr:MAG: formyltetrahydrofolate deformylase [uncultured archaeon A07HB70]
MTREYAEITVIGEDKSGIVAGVTGALFERGVNVEDIDQNVREGIFRMTLHADLSEMVCRRETLRERLAEVGEERGVEVTVRFPEDRERDRVAVLVTKESHCLEKLFAARDAGRLDAEIAVVIGNHDDLEPLAADHDVPFYDVGDESGVPDEERILDLLEEYRVDLVALARYMRILSPDVVFRYEDRIINVHPSLLPAFPGAAAYRQAREDGVRVAGVTAHYVTTDLDQGPIIAQRAFDVPDGASVEEMRARGQPLEAAALVEAVCLHLDDAVTSHWGRTELRDAADEDDYQLGLPTDVGDNQPAEPRDRDVTPAEATPPSDGAD